MIPPKKMPSKYRIDKRNRQDAIAINSARRGHLLGLLEEFSAPIDFFLEEYLTEILRIEDKAARDCFASYASVAALAERGVEALDEEFLGTARD